MGILIKPLNVLKNVVKNELSIVSNSRRAGRIAKYRYPDVKCAKTSMMLKKIGKDVGVEPLVGMAVGMYSNPIPGMSIVGYGLGRGLAECRKILTKYIKSVIKK